MEPTLFITINDIDYPLATTLRVAYKIQGFNNHKSYLDVFKEVDKMPVEKQIEIVYASFSAANPGAMKADAFKEYYLDNHNLKYLMEQMQAIIKGIVGDDVEETEESDTEASEGNE